MKNIKFEEIKDKDVWEKFNLSFSEPSFFQSWTSGEIQKKNGVNVLRYGIFKGKNLFGICQLFEVKAKRGHFFHVRQGPVLLSWDEEIIKEFISFIRSLAREMDISYIRISPLIEKDDKILKDFSDFGFREAPIHNIDAENRWILRLEPSNDELLANLRKTTRYMVKKGEEAKIKVNKSQDVSQIPVFFKVFKETTQLKDFVPPSFIKEEIEQFIKEKNAYIYHAVLNKKVLSSAIVIHYGNQAIYRHGATTLEGRKTQSSYLLQWEAIKDAKKSGLKIYNFWGIAKDNNPKNPWYGLTQFKMGFGGERQDFIHSLDLPLKKSYWASFLVDYFTLIRKGYL